MHGLVEDAGKRHKEAPELAGKPDSIFFRRVKQRRVPRLLQSRQV